MQFLIPLAARRGSLSRQVYGGLRQAVLTGTFRAGDRLPSTRDLAEQLGISRTVVVLAYEQLMAEGFVVTRTGSGTYVPQGVLATRSAGESRSARPTLSHS